MRIAVLLLVIASFFACGGGGSGSNSSTTPPRTQAPAIKLTNLVSGLVSPLDLEQPNDNSGLLFAVEQGGTIRTIQNGTLLTTPFLDISAKIVSGGETGLLGLAFHPNYSQNRLFYLNYNQRVGGQLQTVIAEYKRSLASSTVADPTSERVLLVVNQPFENHKGGQVAFGPDGFLYIGLGDGGSAGDPFNNAQNKTVLLGKMLRIDVNSTSAGKQYAIPPSNPFAAGGGAPEIFAYGFRNPWRFSFDKSDGRFFVADVGQNAFEEIDVVTTGANYGWNIMEGASCYNGASCSSTGLTAPILSYGRSDGTTVIGGFVYRGTQIASLAGAYVFGDFGNGRVWMLVETSPGVWTRTQLLDTGRPISSFGQAQSGELYVIDYAGSVLQVQSQ